MKNKKIFMSLLLAASLTACINDADVDGGSEFITPPVVENGGNTNFRFVVPSTSSSGRSVEDSGNHELGSPAEYAINNIRLYLFYAESKNIYKTFNVNVGNPSTDNNTVTYTSTDEIKLDPGTYDIYAIANRPTPPNAPTVDALLKDIDYSFTDGKPALTSETGGQKLIMTNRGTANLGVTITAPTESNTSTNITIRLERAVAKLMLTRTKDNYDLYDSDNNKFASVSLTNFRYFNLSRWFYTFRHVATLQRSDDENNRDKYLVEPAYTVTDSYFGDIPSTNGYAIDPYFFQKTAAGAESFTNSDGYYAQFRSENSAENINSSMPGVGTYASIYCLENCTYHTSQKRVYSTGIVFKANINIPASRTFSFGPNGEKINVDPNQQSKLYYFNYNFYTSLKAAHDFGGANVPAEENASTDWNKYGMAVYEKNGSGSYDCYYEYMIQHEPSSSKLMEPMEFGVVRNNIYRVSINNITDLGPGTPDFPEIDDKYKAYLTVDFDIYPWILRDDNNGTLGD